MELPPSRSSSTSDCKSLCLPLPDAPEPPPSPDSVDGGSEASWHPTSSSPCGLSEAPGVSLGPSLSLSTGAGGGPIWRERPEAEATLRKIMPAFDALLTQLDRVNLATEELYKTECRLETVGNLKEGRRGTCRDSIVQKRHKGSHRRRHRADKGKSRHDKKNECATGPSKKEEGPEFCPPNKDCPDQEAPQEVLSKKDECRQDDPVKAKVDEVRKEHRAESCPIKVEESAVKIKANAVVMDSGLCRPSKGPRKALSKRKKVNPSPVTDKPAVDGPSSPIPNPSPSVIATPPSTLTPSTDPCLTTATPVPVPHPLDWNPHRGTADLPSSLFNHPAHTATMPTRKRKHKHAPTSNKIHPNTDRPISGHSKP